MSALTYVSLAQDSCPLQLSRFLYCCGRGSMVPFDLAVSGSPPGFWLLSGSPAISVECLVSALLTPSCFPDWMFMVPGALDAED